MASSRDDNPYGEGLGAGGKFRKQPVRRSQTTPYDRPPTAIRNPTNFGSNNAWLSKIVDPANRLLTAGAHRLFSSVFRKRLPAPPSPPPPEVNQEVGDKCQQVAIIESDVAQQMPLHGGNTSNNFDSDGLGELEQILKKKTFTRSEIDRLTAVLHSKTVDPPVEHEEKRSSRPLISHDRKEELPYSPVRESRLNNQFYSTPVVSTSVKLADTFKSNVLKDDVSSPAEIAKAYMGSRSSNVSLSRNGFRGQSLKEDSTVLRNVPFPSKSPAISLVPRNSCYNGVTENGFVTPRSRGRSAVYNMDRTPNFKVHPSSALKIAGPTTDGYGGSSSQFSWVQNGPSGSKHGALKRKNSMLESDIGPIRRIRQKANFVSPRNKILSLSDRPFSSLQNEDCSAVQHSSSSIRTPVLLDESTMKLTNKLEENGNSIPYTSSTPVPSKSREMASKILEQLDKLVPKEKSPTKLSPSTLCGQALRSLGNVDASKFQMSAHEEFVNLDDDVYSNGAACTALAEERQKPDTSAAKFKTVAIEASPVTVEKSTFSYDVKTPGSSAINEITQFENSCDSIVQEEKSSSFTASPLSTGLLPTMEATQLISTSDKTMPPRESNVLSPVSFRDKVASAKESNAVFPTFSFTPKSVENAPKFTSASSSSIVIESFGPKFTSSDPKPEGSTSFGLIATGATDTAPKVPELEKAGSKNKVTFVGISHETENSSSTSDSNASTFSFGMSKSLNNGSVASSSPVFSSAVSPLFSSSASAQNSSIFSISTAAPSTTISLTTTTTITSIMSSPATSAALASSQSAPLFKFDSSIAPSSESTQVSGTSNSAEARVTSPFAIGTSSSIFGVSTELASSTPNNQFQVSNSFGAVSGSLPGTEATPAGTATSTRSLPSLFGSAASVPSFGLGNTTSSSGSSVFSSSMTFGVGASTSSSGVSLVSSSNGTTPSLFGSSWEQTKTPAFGSTFNSSSSTMFSFGQSSATLATANSAPIVFGSAIGASSSSAFSFNSVAATTSSQPVFGSPAPYIFGSSPTSNNDQMNMLDSMAEDSVQASTPPVPVFCQQPPVVPPPSAFKFGSTTLSGASPFQFASQQTLATPSSQSPFQAIGNLEVGGGGSFSLGTTGDKSGRKFVKVRKSRKK